MIFGISEVRGNVTKADILGVILFYVIIYIFNFALSALLRLRRKADRGTESCEREIRNTEQEKLASVIGCLFKERQELTGRIRIYVIDGGSALARF